MQKIPTAAAGAAAPAGPEKGSPSILYSFLRQRDVQKGTLLLFMTSLSDMLDALPTTNKILS